MERRGVHPLMVKRLLDLLEARGERALAAELGAEVHGSRIPYEVVDRHVERAAERLGVEGLGLALAGVQNPEAYGAAGLLLVTAPTFRTGLERAFGYQRLWGDGERFSLGGSEELTIAFAHPGASPIARAVLAECALAEVFASARALVRADARPTRVELAVFGWDTRRLESHFEAPVFLGSVRNALSFGADVADAPILPPSELLRTAFEREARRAVAALEVGPRITERVAAAVERALGDGPADGALRAASIARALHTSARSMQRHLSEEGTTFQEVVDRVRRAQANALERLGTPLKETAYRLGYSDPSALYRALERWRATPSTGESRGRARQPDHKPRGA
ncbi:MAG: AraC family transcriptional regulator ligand-binding domain-containing protein [Polyangiaceae bacterium]